MNRFLKNTILSVAVAATTFATLPAAQAGERWNRRHEVSRQSDDADAILAGLLGLAVGAAIVGAIAQPEPKGPVDRNPYDAYYPPAPRPADVVYYDEPSLEPWSDAWFDYCEARYRTFDPETGTYRGKNGRSHFCTAG